MSEIREAFNDFISDIENAVDDTSRRLDGIQDNVDSLDNYVSELENRIYDLENRLDTFLEENTVTPKKRKTKKHGR